MGEFVVQAETAEQIAEVLATRMEPKFFYDRLFRGRDGGIYKYISNMPDIPLWLPQRAGLGEMDERAKTWPFYWCCRSAALLCIHECDVNIFQAVNARDVCGRCAGCTVKDCGICKCCIDMKKFGGPRRRKQCCVKKRCLQVDSAVQVHLTQLCVHY